MNMATVALLRQAHHLMHCQHPRPMTSKPTRTTPVTSPKLIAEDAPSPPCPMTPSLLVCCSQLPPPLNMADVFSPAGTSVSMSAIAVLQKDAELSTITEMALGNRGCDGHRRSRDGSARGAGCWKSPMFLVFFRGLHTTLFFSDGLSPKQV